MSDDQPLLECDLVMRGGITSGIVYPKAVVELMKTFRFRSIGGTSAGAIAAAVTAAAAYGFAKGHAAAFERIEGLPGELAKTGPGNAGTRLMHLFQPQDRTRPLFSLLIDVLNSGGSKPKILVAIVRRFRGRALIGAVPGLVMLVLIVIGYGLTLSLANIAALVAALLIVIVGAVIWAGLGVAGSVQSDVPANRFGLCSGMTNGQADPSGVEPLTPWLHKLIQDCAGPSIDRPLTVGDLWSAPLPDGTAPADGVRSIDLILMTTNITRGVSTRFPTMEDWRNRMFFFNAEELRGFFPADVVDFMIDKAQAGTTKGPGRLPEGYHQLPKPEHLPVIFGARLSLSFPFLLSAVPLHQIDWDASRNKPVVALRRCWFSDGGLTSNFPVHFFDSAIPSRPTFGINLVSGSVERLEEAPDAEQERELKQTETAPPGRKGAVVEPEMTPDERRAFAMVWMPKTNHPGQPGRFRDIPTDGVMGFAGALFDAARNWTDSEQMMMPGYRERIAHIHLEKHEGGLNLNMDKDTIADVAGRGSAAGKMLAARYAPRRNRQPNKDPKDGSNVVLDWDNHRWVRYRAVMAALEELSRRFHANWSKQRAGAGKEDSYADLLERKISKAPSYPWANGDHQTHAQEVTDVFLDMVESWDGPCQTFDKPEKSTKGQSPRPKSELRIMPPG